MKNRKVLLPPLAALVVAIQIHAAPLGSTFSYQGKLAQNGVAVTGDCDFNFGLWDAVAGGAEVASSVDVLNVPVVNGSFTVQLDFGSGSFHGDARWLEIAVACPSGEGLSMLAPRQELTASPNALFAAEAGVVAWAGVLNIPPDIADGDDVDDDDADPANEIQDLSLSGDMLTLSGDVTSVDLSGYLDNTDDQALEEVLLQGNDAGGVTITNLPPPTADSDASTKAYVDARAGGSQNLAEVLAEGNDAGGIAITNLPAPVAGSDAANRSYVDGHVDADADPTNELQDLSLAANTLSLSGDASTVNLAGFLDNTDEQALDLTAHQLSITNGNSVDLSGYLDNTDDQTLAEVLAEGNDAGGASISNIGTTATNALTISGLDCTGNSNGGALTADASGMVQCSDDDAGAGGGNTLDQAYDQGGAGAGRLITADSGAVSIQGPDGLHLSENNLLQTPGDPVLISSLEIGDESTSVYVSGRYAYVVDSSSADLKVIDITDPESPTLVGSLGIGASPVSVYVAGVYAYVVDQQSDDLKVIDVSNPGAPTLAGTLAIGSAPTCVHVSGRYAYVVDSGTADLKVIDVSDPGVPMLSGSLGIGGQLQSVFVSGPFAYVVGSNLGNLIVIDVSDPGGPSLAGAGEGLAGSPDSVYVSGRYAYVVSDDLGVLHKMDISNPSVPVFESAVFDSGNLTSAYVSGRYAYAVNADSMELKVFDVSDMMEAPTLVGSLGIGAAPTSVFVSGLYAYVVDAGSNDLKVIDISGAEVTALMAHSLEAGNLQVRNDVIAQGKLQVAGGVNVGSGGLFSDGDVSVAADLGVLGDVTAGGNVDVSGNIDVTGTVSGEEGLLVGSTTGDGLYISQAGPYASSGISGDSNGVEVRSAANDGLMVGANGGDGVDIWNAAANGLYVRNAGNHGLRIQNALLNGIDIDAVGGYAIHAATGKNYFAGDTGIGTSTPTHRLHVSDSVSGAASTANHVALIENVTAGNSADILVIKMPEVGAAVDAGNNYISFHDGGGNSLGAIQGNGAGSVSYAGAGNDYAEYLPRLDRNEQIFPGDLVGIHAGRVSKRTTDADLVLAASTGAIVAGNDPGEENRDAYTLVAFLGQADLQVLGPVMAGDLIVASGNNDGVGVAVNSERLDIQLLHQVVGQAWETNPDPRIKEVRSVVGLVQPRVISQLLRGHEDRLRRIEKTLGLE